jgi:hypothetical protein
VYIPTEFPEPDENGCSPANESTLKSPVYRADLQSSVTFSIGPLLVRWKFEIVHADDAGTVSAETEPRPIGRSVLRRAVRRRAPESSLGKRGAAHPDQITSSHPEGLEVILDAGSLRHPQLDGENCTVILSDAACRSAVR